MKVNRKEILPFVSLTSVTTDKFKTGFLSINLLTQLDKETAAKNALLPSVLLRGTNKYPDMEKLAAYKEELYGLVLEPVVRKKGEIHCTGFYADFIDDKFLPGSERLMEKAAELLGEVLLNPVTSGGLLKQEYVDSERANMLDRIDSMINEKASYAVSRLVADMCSMEPYAIDRLGDRAQAEEITAQSLTKYYHKVLESATVEVFYCGSAGADSVELAVKNALMTLPRTQPDYDMGTDVRMNSVESEPRYFTEEMDVTQGKLVLGFRLGEVMNEPNYAQIMLFNAIYGGTVNSKLFLNVREKLSLAYYASSNIERHKGIMLVSSGIEFDKYDTAKAEILAQLDSIREGTVDKTEFLNAQKATITDMRTVCDSQGGLENFYLGQAVEGLDYSPLDMVDMLERVELSQCIEVARSVQLDAVYFLKAHEAEKEAVK